MTFISEHSIARYLHTGNKFLIKAVCGFFKIHTLNLLYDKCKKYDGIEFIDALFQILNIKLEIVNFQKLEYLKESRFTIVSNHPFGILDGFILLKLFASDEIDCKIVGHSYIKNAKPIRKFILPVMPYKNRDRHKYMVKDGKRLLEHITSNKPLIIFPSGKVSTFSWKEKKITDQEWSNTAIKFLLKSKRSITPVYINGRNTVGYVIMNFLNVNLGMIWLIREFLAKANSTITIKIGPEMSINNCTISQAKKQLRKAVYELS
jgi:putative hemolysin